MIRVSTITQAKAPDVVGPILAQKPRATAPAAGTRAGAKRNPTAIVYCEGNLGAIDGKTANGLVRHSERYNIIAVIDSQKAGRDAGEILDGKPNLIPVFRGLADALAHCDSLPDYFIYGMAPATGMLSKHETQGRARSDRPRHEYRQWTPRVSQ